MAACLSPCSRLKQPNFALTTQNGSVSVLAYRQAEQACHEHSKDLQMEGAGLQIVQPLHTPNQLRACTWLSTWLEPATATTALR